MNFAVRLTIAMSALALWSACSADSGARASCDPPELACTCDDGSNGVAVCDPGGERGDCICSDDPDAGGGDADGDDAGGAPDAGGQDTADAGSAPDAGSDEDADCTRIQQWPDNDGDGIGGVGTTPVEACEYLDGYSLANTDCNDNDPDVFPFAPELCDQRDNDCDDEVDENTAAVDQWPDADEDGYGDPDATPERDCRPLEGFVRNQDDCDDSDAQLSPDATDLCDGIDQDCDGDVDEDADFALFWPDTDDDTYGDAEAVPVSACAQPPRTATNREDCNDADAEIRPGATEVCDLIDNDCDGSLDEGTPLLVLYPDNDGDGYGDNFSGSTLSCEPVARFATRQGDCDDTNPDINPDGDETCDRTDEDCDGLIDEQAIDQRTFYADVDGDGAGNAEDVILACEAPPGYVDDVGDCDDRNGEISIADDEVCDGIDNDCDGVIDNGVANRCGTCGPVPEEICGDFIDNDCDDAIDEPEDGCFCDGRTNQPCYPAEPQTLGIGACRGGVVSCECPSGTRFCEDGVYGACVGAVTPQPEICNGIDDNCDGRVDEGVRNACGGCGPVDIEICDGIDNDCDNLVDEGLRNACGQCPGEEAEEVCNSFDDDCDGFVDEGCTCSGEAQPCYPGPPSTLDVGSCAAGTRDCYATAELSAVCVGATLPQLEVCNGEDDDCDGQIDIGPDGCSVCGRSEEICDGIDNNCDGFVDEGLRNACGDCLDTLEPEELGGLALCNGLDDDCDGLIDEELVNACGTCDEVCYLDDYSSDDEFDEGEGEGVEVDDGVRLNSSSFTFSDLWVANTNDDTVTRIDTQTGSVVGTYSVNYRPGRGDDDPSRTAVDFDGNAWVANRAFGGQGSIAKIRGGDCVTDCVEFIVPVGGINNLPRGLAIDTDGNVWVGLDNARRLVKLDGTDGSVIDTFDIGIRTYGLAIDNTGIIWIATIDGGVIGAFDTNTDSYLGAWGSSSCMRPYGIAVDGDGNVWAGNWTCGNLVRLDRASFDAGDRPPRYDFYGSGLSNTRGVAVDGNNTIWLASSGNNRVARFNRTTGAQLGTSATCGNPIGVGVANDGDVWVACYNDDLTHRFGPDGALRELVPVGDQPYSYSDMTGFQLRNFTSPRGTWSTTFDCTFDDCSFDYVSFETTTPAGTAVALRFRSQEDGGAWSEWTESFAVSPADLRDIVPHGRFLDIEATLTTSENGISPVLSSVDVEWQRP